MAKYIVLKIIAAASILGVIVEVGNTLEILVVMILLLCYEAVSAMQRIELRR